MKQFLIDEAKDDILMAWRGLKLEKGETIQKYTDKFWDLHLKAMVNVNGVSFRNPLCLIIYATKIKKYLTCFTIIRKHPYHYSLQFLLVES